jgi:hypothetical protein
MALLVIPTCLACVSRGALNAPRRLMSGTCDARWDEIETGATTWQDHDCATENPDRPLMAHEGGWESIQFALRVVGRYPDGHVTRVKNSTVWLRDCKWNEVSRIDIGPGRSVLTFESNVTYELETRELKQDSSGLTELEIKLRTSGYPGCVEGRVVKSIATYPQWMFVSAPGCGPVLRMIDATWQGARVVELKCTAASPNSALSPPHSVVTARADSSTRRAVRRAG